MSQELDFSGLRREMVAEIAVYARLVGEEIGLDQLGDPRWRDRIERQGFGRCRHRALDDASRVVPVQSFHAGSSTPVAIGPHHRRQTVCDH